MSTFIQFVNRVRELEFLEKQFRKGNAFIVVYGRRRVGKSELLKQFIKGKKALYLLAAQEVEKDLMESFSAEVSGFFADTTLKVNPFVQFRQLIEYLKEKDLNGVVLIMDEFPYIIDANNAVPSLLQKHWDTSLKTKGLNIILCGSSIGAMETEVLGRKSPLYGRRTGQWKVDPLSFRHYADFFPNAGLEKLAEFYSITGGVPAYIREFDGGKTVFENAKLAVASRGSLLYQEVEVLLKEELREPKTYFSILRAIANGKTVLNEISNALGVQHTKLTRYIDTLMELDLVEATKPVDSAEKARNTRYILKDNYFRFWFRFVQPFKKQLDSGIFKSFEENFHQNFNSYVGRRFEEICQEILLSSNPINANVVGPWWGNRRVDGKREEIEVDAVALNKQEKQMMAVECKWQENVSAESIVERLSEKTDSINWQNTKRVESFGVFAKTFKNKITEFHGKKVFCFDLADIEKGLRG